MGRLAVTLMVIGLLGATVGLGLAGGSRGGSTGAPTGTAVVVEHGQTLSGLAAAHLPQMEIVDGISAIQIANGLSSDRVLAGQRLVIPRP